MSVKPIVCLLAAISHCAIAQKPVVRTALAGARGVVPPHTDHPIAAAQKRVVRAVQVGAHGDLRRYADHASPRAVVRRVSTEPSGHHADSTDIEQQNSANRKDDHLSDRIHSQAARLGSESFTDETDYRKDIDALLRNVPACTVPRMSKTDAIERFKDYQNRVARKERLPPFQNWLFPQTGIGAGVLTDVIDVPPSSELLRTTIGDVEFEVNTYNLVPRDMHANYRLYNTVGSSTYGNYFDNKSLGASNRFIFEMESPSYNGSALTLLRTSGILSKADLPFAASVEKPGHGILAADAKGSGHSWHQHAGAYNTQFIGRKLWTFLPPAVTFGEHRSPKLNEEEFVHPNACSMIRRSPMPTYSTHFQCVAEPGQSMVFPDSVWHATCALDGETMSVGATIPS